MTNPQDKVGDTNAHHRRGERYLTVPELSAKLGNRSRSAIYTDIAAGRLPMPIKLGGSIYWPEDELDAHLRGLRQEVA